MADSGSASQVLSLEKAAAATGEPGRRGRIPRAGSASRSGRIHKARPGRADVARGDGKPRAALPQIGGDAFLRVSLAAIYGSCDRTESGCGLDWTHPAEVHREPAQTAR